MIQRTMIILFLFIPFIPTIVKCSNVEAKDETIFPNGTLVGKYSYVDMQGNQVHVKYFADADSYSVDLRGYKISDSEDDNARNSTMSKVEPTTEVDSMVPLKLDFPAVENIYTIENTHNFTDDIDDDKKQTHERNENEDQAEDYDIYNSVLQIPRSKTYEKNKRAKKTIRKIRQTLDIFMRKIPNL